jgi:signal peptidase I
MPTPAAKKHVPRPEPIRAERAAPTAASRPAKSETLEWIKSLGVALLLFLFIRTFLFQAYSIPSGSMENTLLVGDYLMANNTVFGAHVPFTDLRLPGIRDPRHGDIVVFDPDYNRPVIDVVKRVMGEPGDTLQMIAHQMYRNGKKLNEPYITLSDAPDYPIQYVGQPGSLGPEVQADRYGYHWHLAALPAGVNHATYRPTRDNWGPLVVPGGHYFLMGDNRDESLDSRFMGFIPRDVIRGKPLFVYFSYDPNAGAPFPSAITAARWSRIGRIVR